MLRRCVAEFVPEFRCVQCVRHTGPALARNFPPCSFGTGDLTWSRPSFVVARERNGALQLIGEISIPGSDMHRLARFLAHPLVQFFWSRAHKTVFAANGHTLCGPSLHHGNRFSQEGCDLLPAFQDFRFFLCIGFWIRFARHIVGPTIGCIREAQSRCNRLNQATMASLP